MELSGLNPLGSAAVAAVAMPQRAGPDVQKVDPGQKSNCTGTDARQHPEQDATASQARDINEIRQEMEKRNLPAGPPPTFELSLLEVERDLKQVLARIEAERATARDTEAVKADSDQQKAAETEAHAAQTVSAAKDSAASAQASLAAAQSTPLDA
jgi:hypothetical protein